MRHHIPGTLGGHLIPEAFSLHFSLAWSALIQKINLANLWNSISEQLQATQIFSCW